jgi:hypothetical protein
MTEQATIIWQGKEYVDCTPVEPGNECPNCTEARYDWLSWDDQDWLTCQTCGYIYDPLTGELHPKTKQEIQDAEAARWEERTRIANL